MKSFLFVVFALLVFYLEVCSQCPNIKIVTPDVAEPMDLTLVASTCSTLAVQWQGKINHTYTVSATRYNPSTNTSDTVAGSTPTGDANFIFRSVIPVIAGRKITWTVQARTVINQVELYSYAAIGVLEYPIRDCSGIGVTFKGKVMLQGAYDPFGDTMTTTLNKLGILDAKATFEPYSNEPYNYFGGERVEAGFFAAHPDVVDWVLLELRDANVATTSRIRRAVFVKKDGTMVDIDGVSTAIDFPGAPTGNYHVVIRHRNHLSIRTSSPLDFSTDTAYYDFTRSSIKSFKNKSYTSEAQAGTRWVMRAGDANVNQNVRYVNPQNDQTHIFNNILGGSLSRIITDTYTPEDINMDGVIKWTNPGNEQNFLLNILLNGFFSTAFAEQL